ncbi:MAG: hypothetical protein ACRYG2_13520 [Janthinobacterium lividum]
MTSEAVRWSGRDLGLDRTFDLSRSALRTRTVRRRLLVVLILVVTIGPVVAVTTVWPDALDRPVLELPFAATPVGLGLMGLAIVVMLVGTATMVRAGSNPFRNHDPLLDLPRADRSWVRARVAASAPVAPDQQPFVADAARWMARQTGTVPIYLGLTLEGLGFVIATPGVLDLLIGLVLIIEGVLLATVAVGRARSARRWSSLYAVGLG